MKRLAPGWSLGLLPALLLLPARGPLGAAGAVPLQDTDPPATAPSATPADPRPGARPADVATPDALLAAVYDVISGPAGEARDWDRFRSLFTADARLAAVVPGPGEAAARLVVMTPEEYVARSGPMLERSGFFERELARRTERFGHVLHAFSTYAGRSTADGEDVLRGVNSFQLVHDGARWAVHSILWEAESEALPLPERYLPER